MLRDPHHGLRSEALGLNRRIHEVAEQLLDLVNGLLDLGQLEAGKAPVSTEPLPLDHFLNDLRARERMPLNSAVRLVWDVPAELPVIESDSEKLSVVVENLIGNACKFTLKGTVTVTVRDFARERWIELSVADTGPGIAEADLSRIFEPFCQVQESPMRGKTGYGLGLAIVRRQLELLGGEMRVESRLEHGSTFTIRLPYSPPPASAASPDHLGSVDPAEPTSVRLPSAA
jgi:signal transduction histidine kinase